MTGKRNDSNAEELTWLIHIRHGHSRLAFGRFVDLERPWAFGMRIGAVLALEQSFHLMPEDRVHQWDQSEDGDTFAD